MKVICKRRRDESDDDHSHLGPELKKDNLDYFDSKDDHHHGDLGNKRNITSEKDEHDISKNDDDDDNDDDDWAFELRKREEKRKGLKRKYNSPPSSHHQDLPEEHTRKKDLIKEPRRSYENDAEDKDFDFKKSKIKGKGLMMHREKKRVKYNSPPSTIHRDSVTFPSEKNELAVATEYIRKIDDDDDVDDNDWASDLKKLEEKGKGLKRKFYLPPSSHHQDLPEDKKLFNSKGNDHGIQIREPRKRSYENDAEDKDWDFDSKKSKNKGKGLMMHREKKRVKYNSPPCTIQQDLPENFKRKIETMGGDSNKAQLVSQKRLYKSDIDKQQNRLSLPMNQLLYNFLEPDEVRRLENTRVRGHHNYRPMGEEEPVCFKKWTYKETVKSYVLITQWSDVAKKNGLKPGDSIQVWSFCDRENNLHLAVVRRDESSDGSAAGCSSGSNAANASTSAVGGEGSSINANTSSVGGEGSGGDHAKEDGITAGVAGRTSGPTENRYRHWHLPLPVVPRSQLRLRACPPLPLSGDTSSFASSRSVSTAALLSQPLWICWLGDVDDERSTVIGGNDGFKIRIVAKLVSLCLGIDSRSTARGGAACCYCVLLLRGGVACYNCVILLRAATVPSGRCSTSQ
ncbi:hypothetical protein ACLB2K_049673 [Fragaria x ananassa]